MVGSLILFGGPAQGMRRILIGIIVKGKSITVDLVHASGLSFTQARTLSLQLEPCESP